LTHHLDIRVPAAEQSLFRTGIDDAIILPLVLVALLARTLYRAARLIVLVAFDFVFALFLRVLTFPLLVAATAGDGMAWLIKRLADVPSLPGAKRDGWRDLGDRRWSGLRQRMSHRAVADAVQRLLQEAISWGFRKCGALSPRAALLVIASAILWLPLSAAISIAMHAVLLAKAASLPAWMQLLHPVATIIAKSKILVLPVYPAAWPQAKKHAWVQAAFHCMHCIAALNCIRKAAHRYQQAETGFAQAGDGLRRAASRIGTASPT
jgi:hypothetical protein